MIAHPSNSCDPQELTLGIVTDIHHWRDAEGRLCSFGPYVREIDIWNRIFGKTVIAGGVGKGPMPDFCLPYARQDIIFIPIFHVPGSSFLNRLKRVINIPMIAINVFRLIGQVDFIHLRSPSFSILISLFLLRFTRKARIAKWAGEFSPWRGEPVTSRIQRTLFKFRFLRGPVMVYGDHTTPHLVPFFPAAMSTEELDRAINLSATTPHKDAAIILMVGRLVEAKGFDLGIRALGRLAILAPGLKWRAVVIGEGIMLNDLYDLAQRQGIGELIEFAGGKPFDEVLEFFAQADVLLMPGQLEGFAKVLIEACASRTIPVATNVGLSPWILDYGRRGILSSPEPEDLGQALYAALTMSPERRQEMVNRGTEWVKGLTLEEFEKQLRMLIEQTQRGTYAS